MFPRVSPCHDMCLKKIVILAIENWYCFNVFSKSKAFHGIIIQEKSFTITFVNLWTFFFLFLYRKCVMALKQHFLTNGFLCGFATKFSTQLGDEKLCWCLSSELNLYIYFFKFLLGWKNSWCFSDVKKSYSLIYLSIVLSICLFFLNFVTTGGELLCSLQRPFL